MLLTDLDSVTLNSYPENLMQQMVRVELRKCCLSALTKIIMFRIKILLNTLSPCSQFTSIKLSPMVGNVKKSLTLHFHNFVH